MPASRLKEITTLGQAIWIDDLNRRLLDEGELARMIEEDGLTGVTSNPTIFAKAAASDRETLRRVAADADDPRDVFFRLAYEDIRKAADLLRGVYDRTGGRDGYVSFELPPELAYDVDGAVAAARRFRDEIGRENVLIKVPGTEEGVRAFEELTADGVSINVTLLFAVERYEQIAEAYLRGLERRVARGEPVDGIASVASFFVSRVDTAVDRALEALGRPDLTGRAGVANAKIAYESFARIFSGPRWEALRAHGANVQRPLWASTSTKNPAYPDTRYVDELIGPDTVNTMPSPTIAAARDHARVEASITRDLGAAHEAMAEIRAAGVDVDAIVLRQLVHEGIDAFAASFAATLATVGEAIAGGEVPATGAARDGALRGSATRRLGRAHVDALAQQLRVDSIRASTAAGSGHPTSSMSAADLMAVLLAGHLRYDWLRPALPTNDRLVFSKGHASPLLYAMYKAVGAISDDELITTYRRAGSRLQGHPTPALPWVDVATGSLGQGLPAAVGIALAGARLDKLPYHVYVLCGDSEMAEGSIWEALDKAAYNELANLTVIVDVNRLGQRGPTELEWDLAAYRERVEAFGCWAVPLDGHDLGPIDEALDAARGDGRPTVLLARTVKGKGWSGVENVEGMHGKPLSPADAEQAIAALGGVRPVRVPPRLPDDPDAVQAQLATPARTLELPSWSVGETVATRDAFGAALAALGAARPDVVALDGEVADSTRTAAFAAAHPDRFFELFIAEQQLVAAAVGLATRGYVPFAATFGAFLSRAYDFVRMAGISEARVCLVGSHAGVEIGADGPSQMALEDLAALRAVHGSTVVYPADATATAALVAALADHPGVTYLRTTRGGYPVLYEPGEPFPIGGAKVLRGGTGDDAVALIGAGVTVHECLAAAAALAEDGIAARVIDLYSVKPVDVATVRAAARDTGGRLIVVEDHYPEGGIGAAVLEALAQTGDPLDLQLVHLAVRTLPGSATSAEQLDLAGISRTQIATAARQLLAASPA